MKNQIDDEVKKEIISLAKKAEESRLQDKTADELLFRLGEDLTKEFEDKPDKRDIFSADFGQAFIDKRSSVDFKTKAEEFLAKQEKAFRTELCDPAKGCLKQKYEDLLGGKDFAGQVTVIAQALIAVVNPAYAVPAIFITIAIWLLRVQLNAWCGQGTKTDGDPLQSIKDGSVA